MIGLNLRVKDVVQLINAGERPVVYLHDGVVVISITEDVLGTFMYHKFVDNVAQYTVRIPYSHKNTLGELLQNGEAGLYPHTTPELGIIPT